MGVRSRRSIRTKSLVAASALILLVVATLSTASFIVLRSTLREHAKERLSTLSGQLGDLTHANMTASRTRAISIAGRPEITAYLTSPSPELEDSARRALAYGGTQPELSVASELRHASGQLILSSASTTNAATSFDAELPDWKVLSALASTKEGIAYGRVRNHGEMIVYPTVARVPESEAFFVHWRRLSNNGGPARNLVAGIFGTEAALFFGNADGSVWSEFGRPAHSPPVEFLAPTATGAFEFYRPSRRGNVLAVRRLIEGTPWAVTVEFPTRVIEAPARGFLLTMSLIAAACLLVGVLAARLMSQRITGPLETMASAADAIAHGRPAAPLAVTRDDEIGQLAASFNAMAAEVEVSRRRLESAVEERTGELRQAKESLARREKLAVIGHLASGIGHEIRNPLGVMATAVQYLQTIQPDASPQVRKHLDLLRDQIQLSAKIVNDLLDLSRTTPANRTTIEVDRLIDERLQRLMSSTSLEADIPADLPRVVVDPVHAGQVLDNLFTNALQAMSGQPGKVRVSARATGDGFVRLEISDTGPGISRENVGKIFEPLFTTKPSGVGLGLALSKSLAQANGGDLALVSGPDQSATFAFFMPAEGTA